MAKTNEAWPVGVQLKNPLTVTEVPPWVRDGDVIVRRQERYFVVSMHESETRWQKLKRWSRKLTRSAL